MIQVIGGRLGCTSCGASVPNVSSYRRRFHIRHETCESRMQEKREFAKQLAGTTRAVDDEERREARDELHDKMSGSGSGSGSGRVGSV
jgi:hypothetical protein